MKLSHTFAILALSTITSVGFAAIASTTNNHSTVTPASAISFKPSAPTQDNRFNTPASAISFKVPAAGALQ